MPNRTKAVVAETCIGGHVRLFVAYGGHMVSCGGPTGRMVMVWEARRAGSDMLAHVPFTHKAPAGARIEN